MIIYRYFRMNYYISLFGGSTYQRKIFKKCCVRFSNMTSILLPAMPGAALSAVSYYNLSILQLQACFQRCLRGVPPVVSTILNDLPSMYDNMSLFVICGINGCHMCRSTEQWAKVLPLSIYEHYLNVFKH